MVVSFGDLFLGYKYKKSHEWDDVTKYATFDVTCELLTRPLAHALCVRFQWWPTATSAGTLQLPLLGRHLELKSSFNGVFSI